MSGGTQSKICTGGLSGVHPAPVRIFSGIGCRVSGVSTYVGISIRKFPAKNCPFSRQTEPFSSDKSPVKGLFAPKLTPVRHPSVPEEKSGYRVSGSRNSYVSGGCRVPGKHPYPRVFGWVSGVGCNSGAKPWFRAFGSLSLNAQRGPRPQREWLALAMEQG